jgi:hypothetical protein
MKIQVLSRPGKEEKNRAVIAKKQERRCLIPHISRHNIMQIDQQKNNKM